MVLYQQKAGFSRWTSSYNDDGSSANFSSPNNLSTVTSGVSGANGTVVSILGPLAFNASHLRLEFSGSSANATDTRTMLDVLIDPAGGTAWSGTPLVSDVLCGFLSNTSNIYSRMTLDLPLFIPEGASLGVQARTIGAAARTLRVGLTASQAKSGPFEVPCGGKAVTIGSRPAALNGTLIAGSGVSNGWTSFTSIGSPLESDTWGMSVLCGGRDASIINVNSVVMCQLVVGGQPIWQPFFISSSNIEVLDALFLPAPCPVVVPAGSQLQVRMKRAATNTEDFGFCVYGVQ